MTGIYKTGTSWIIALLYLLIAFLLLDLAKVAGLVPAGWARTGNWTPLIAAVSVVAVTLAIGNVVYHNKKRVEVDIALGKDTGQAEPLKIVALSDLHLGYGIGKRELERWVRMINRERPDAVLIAGDIADSDLRPLREQGMAGILRRLETKYGVFAVLGNHEYISGLDGSIRFMEEAGITLLRDSVALVGGSFYIAGRDDLTNRGRKTAQELLSGLVMSKPVIVIDHQPYALGEIAEAGADVQVSGHTHRGQVWPISWITDAMFEKSHGHLQKDGTHFYISSGLGIWGGKFRIGTRSEYAVINISGR